MFAVFWYHLSTMLNLREIHDSALHSTSHLMLVPIRAARFLGTTKSTRVSSISSIVYFFTVWSPLSTLCNSVADYNYESGCELPEDTKKSICLEILRDPFFAETLKLTFNYEKSICVFKCCKIPFLIEILRPDYRGIEGTLYSQEMFPCPSCNKETMCANRSSVDPEKFFVSRTFDDPNSIFLYIWYRKISIYKVYARISNFETSFTPLSVADLATTADISNVQNEDTPTATYAGYTLYANHCESTICESFVK